MNCDFTLAHYQEILKEALAQGYVFLTFYDLLQRQEAPPRFLLLRHDIDLSVERAAEMASLEGGMGVVSTYFVRLHAQAYNPFQLASFLKLRALHEQGHELGLHYEVPFYEQSREDAVAMLAREKGVLESILNTPVWGATAHLPSQSGGPLPESLLRQAGFLYEGYDPRFTRHLKYISDSSRRWREGCLCTWLGREQKLCVLMHPYWWFPGSDQEKDRVIAAMRNGY